MAPDRLGHAKSTLFTSDVVKAVIGPADSDFTKQHPTGDVIGWLNQLPEDIKHLPCFNYVFLRGKRGPYFNGDCTMGPIFTALIEWAQIEEEHISSVFACQAYQQLYLWIRQIIAGRGRRATSGVSDLILRVLDTIDDRPREFWDPIRQSVAKYGEFPDPSGDREAIGKRLGEMWEKIEPGTQQVLIGRGQSLGNFFTT